MLAAIAYVRNPAGLQFVSPKQWSRQNLFSVPSIWDIALVKPRFSCNIDLSLSERGYDVAEWLAKQVDAFKFGAKCEQGFKFIPTSEVNVKPDWEFGAEGTIQHVPDLRNFHVSVMYRTFGKDDVDIFDMSISKVIKHFTDAHEVVVVAAQDDEALVDAVLEKYRGNSPFPLRVITEPALMDDNVQQKYSKVIIVWVIDVNAVVRPALKVWFLYRR